MKSSFVIAEQAPRLPNTPWRFALYFYRKFRFPLMGIFLFETLQAACTILLPYAVKQIIDAVMLSNRTGVDVFNAVREPMILFALLNLGILLFSRASGALLVSNGPRLRALIRQTIFRYLQYHSHRYFITHFAGSLASRISEVAQSCNQALWAIAFTFYPLLIQSMVALVILYSVSQQLAIVLSLWLLVYTLVSIVLARRCQGYAKDFAAARSKVTGKVVDSVTNMMNAKMFARHEFEEEYLNGFLREEVTHAQKTFWFMEKMQWFQYAAALVLMVSMVGYALKLWVRGDLGVGDFSMVAGVCITLIQVARGLSRSFLDFFEYIGNIADGVGIFVQPHEIVDRPQASALKLQHGQIRFDDVCFGYSEGQRLFDHLNVTIEAGQKVGLVGFSGSGKSTFVNLLLRLFEADSGSISIDGQNILEVTQNSLRENVSLIPQDPILFHRTLMENIRYGCLTASDEEVMEAAKKANAHEFIIASNEGYASLVGERGVKLSGGQRQRISIARAILKNAPILILDEATSSLDSVTERKIQEAMDRLMQNKTVLVIAHRLSTVAHMDRILVFDQGAIVEDGSHNELLHRDGGYYAHLWRMQADGFLPDHELVDL